MSEDLTPALTPEEWAGVVAGTVGIVGTPDAKANHQVAACALYGQPFGFTHEDVALIRHMARAARRDSAIEDDEEAAAYRLADRMLALLPPEDSRE